MNNSITTYYIPNNPNIQKGLIYTLYINNNKNLDLSSIINKENITINKILTPTQEQTNNNSLEILTEINESLQNTIKDIEIFAIKEKEKITSLINKNIEYQNKLRKEDKIE